MSTSDIYFDAQSNGQLRSDAGTPISLEEEYFDVNFTNRSQDSLVRSPTPSGSELGNLSDADEDLPTLEHHLGVNPDAHITYFFQIVGNDITPMNWRSLSSPSARKRTVRAYYIQSNEQHNGQKSGRPRRLCLIIVSKVL